MKISNRQDTSTQAKETKQQRGPGLSQITAPIKRVWGFDITSDRLDDGRNFLTLTVTDETIRTVLATEVGVSIPSWLLIKTLDRLIDKHALPDCILVDHGPEMACHHFHQWAAAKGIKLNSFRRSDPSRKAYAERVSKSSRQKSLAARKFKRADKAQQNTER